MLPSDDEGVPVSKLRTMQIITVALLLGVVIFLGIALTMRAQGGFGEPPAQPLLTYLALGCGLLMAVGHLVLPDLALGGMRRQIAQGTWQPTGEDGQPTGPVSQAAALLAFYQTRLLVTLALLEGGAFFCLIAYMLEGRLLAPLGASLLLGLMALRFPTRDGVEQWLDRERHSEA